MSEILKLLGQSVPSPTVLTDLYTVPSNTSSSISSIIICNHNSSEILFRISVAVGGVVDNPKQYIYFDLNLEGNDTFIATIGLSLAATDVVRIKSDTGNVSFTICGVEII